MLSVSTLGVFSVFSAMGVFFMSDVFVVSSECVSFFVCERMGDRGGVVVTLAKKSRAFSTRSF